MQSGPWIYWRRSSSEPATSIDSYNWFADAELTSSDRSLLSVVEASRCYSLRARYIIKVLFITILVGSSFIALDFISLKGLLNEAL